MTHEELNTALAGLRPAVTCEDGAPWLQVRVEAADWKALAPQLKADLGFDYLFCLTCIDWKTHLEMVYHLESTGGRHKAVFRIKLDREKPEVETACRVWRTAEFHEREAYDLFGVRFLNHPDLRRLLLTDDWEGWPLRKDYEDPVNMIKL